MPCHGSCWSWLWRVNRCASPAVPRGPILSEIVEFALALAGEQPPRGLSHSDKYINQVFATSLCHILYVFSQVYWKSIKLYSSRQKKIKAWGNHKMICYYVLMAFPLCLYTDSYLNDIKGEFSQKDHPSLPPAPSNLKKQDFVLHSPCLFCKRAGERWSSQWGVLVLLHCWWVPGCTKHDSVQGWMCGSQRGCPATDRLRDVSWAGCCPDFEKPQVRFASRMSLLLKLSWFKMWF